MSLKAISIVYQAFGIRKHDSGSFLYVMKVIASMKDMK